VAAMALFWPSYAGFLMLLGSAVCVGAIWGAHANGAGKYFGEAGYATVPLKVKDENEDGRSHRHCH
ncbi:MAG: hypothetical protein ABSA59_02795, partial [Terriglobia bacterium]|jgi:hypothetical protein